MKYYRFQMGGMGFCQYLAINMLYDRTGDDYIESYGGLDYESEDLANQKIEVLKQEFKRCLKELEMLPVPECCEYIETRSYFTQEGYRKFRKVIEDLYYVYCECAKYMDWRGDLDLDVLTIIVCEEEEVKEYIEYEDKWQIAISEYRYRHKKSRGV